MDTARLNFRLFPPLYWELGMSAYSSKPGSKSTIIYQKIMEEFDDFQFTRQFENVDYFFVQ